MATFNGQLIDIVIGGIPVGGFGEDGIVEIEIHTEAIGVQRRDTSRLINTRRAPCLINSVYPCECCWRARHVPEFLAEYFAQTGEPHFFALCPRCWRGLPAAVRRQYARK